jgi:hypothetical protein
VETEIQRIEAALGSMTALGPRGLVDYLRQPTPDFSPASDVQVAVLIDQILSDDPNDPSRLRFSSLMREWDNAQGPSWGNDTARNTDERRNRIHELLKGDQSLRNRIDSLIPFFRLEEPLIIREKHSEWYDPKPGLRDYYWQTYKRYLKDHKGWEDESLLGLDNTTRAVLECLANPESREAYSSRGLVVGYVQSGKTANFAGVIARAADAGYRLIVVMAGTWNILRNQTQRRLDKELLGKEFLQNDESYKDPAPRDWDEFLEHGFDPVERGIYGWQRLTRPDIDFKRLKSAIDNLEFERREQFLPLYDPANLQALRVKLLVVKKHRGILKKLVNDLKLLRTKLADLPTLIIDDESDQAGLNTVDPHANNTAAKKRSKTNEVIVELLALFPRGQYVGYTATPYANALVDPDDPEDLFPKDFIVSLERPAGYMGVLDFFDPEVEFTDLDQKDYAQKEIAYVRRVANPQDADDDDLQKAIRSYVLSGALKIYRQLKYPNTYSFRHHTMLIHTSASTASQYDLGERVKGLWSKCAFNTPAGLAGLEQLWKEDFLKVSLAQAKNAPRPDNFKELIPHLSETIERIESGAKCFIVVNYSSKEAPDFSEAPVWKIIIGGNKLSRGYTVEGLTVSYYRRVASTADTLMQMGRWFGFRQGYQDLVRVFLGVADGKNAVTDLVSMFKQVCLMEERFREEITRYVRTPGQPPITPKQIPPLISVSGQLPPTSRNKMFNAVIEDRNYGGRWSQPTLIANGSIGLTKNTEALVGLIQQSRSRALVLLGGQTRSPNRRNTISVPCWVFEVDTPEVMDFLSRFHWQETKYKYPDRPIDIELQLEFLTRQNHGIKSWRVIAPQRKVSFGKPLIADNATSLTAKQRKRLDSGVFQNFGEPAHRITAEFLTGLNKVDKEYIVKPSQETSELMDPHRGVLLVYPVRETEQDSLSVGFEMLYPKNNLPFTINFTVQRYSAVNSITVSV